MTAPREDRVRLHPVWIGCYSATAWIPVGMWVALLLEAFAAPAQERLAYGLAGAYMTLIAGFIGALLGCCGVALLARCTNGVGRKVLMASTFMAFVPTAFALVVLTLDGLIS